MRRSPPTDVNGSTPGASASFQDAPTENGSGPATGRSAEEPLRAVREELGRAWTAWRRSWMAERRLWQLRAFDLSLRIGIWTCALLCASALSLVAAYLIVRSLRLGLERWSGGAWWSDLVLGTFILAVIAFAIARARRGVHRRALARVQLELALPPSDPDAAQEVLDKDRERGVETKETT